ncbi:hypothetical protein ACA593_02350 [Lactiplantibacillus pentosus]|uniref:hypothetical protein n=1 Tax=Lactiplantibacillus pentosus TaxID=1589 RepID=UPI003C2AA61D
MAKNTSVALRNKMIYSIFPRNYTDNGGFNAIKNDLSRIKDLGTDIVWLMPIYPVGQKIGRAHWDLPMQSLIIGQSTRN